MRSIFNPRFFRRVRRRAPFSKAVIGYTLPADSGTYSLNGTAANFAITMPAASGTYSLSGTDANFKVLMPAGSGTYSVSGTAAIFHRVVAAGSGTYSLSGTAANFAIVMPAASGSYSVAGIAGLQQTDTSTGGDGGTAQCSGAALASQKQFRLIDRNGSPGSTPAQVTLDASPDEAGVFFETPSGQPGLLTWQAGNYVVRLNVTTAASGDVTWSDTYICRVNSSSVNQGTVGSLTGQTTSVSSTGVKTHTVSGSEQTADVGDRLYVVLVFSNAETSSVNFSFTPDQVIDTPWSIAALLEVDRKLSADSVTYALSGTAANFAIAMPADSGTYSVSGTAANFAIVMPAASGSYVLSGTAASLLLGRKLSADSGTFVLTGTDADLVYGASQPTLNAESGTFTLTGTAATFAIVMPAASGTFTLTGTSATFAIVMPTDSGSYVLSGTAATLKASHPPLSADAGTYTLSGTAATFAISRAVSAESGTYSFTGSSAILSWSGSGLLTCDSGTFTITGTAASLTKYVFDPTNDDSRIYIFPPRLRRYVFEGRPRTYVFPERSRTVEVP